jgi:hypothetical protein
VIGAGRVDVAARGRVFALKIDSNVVQTPWSFIHAKDRDAVAVCRHVIADVSMLTAVPEKFEIGSFGFESKKTDPGEIACSTMPSLTITVRYQQSQARYMVEAYVTVAERGDTYYTEDARSLADVVRDAAKVILRRKADAIEETISAKLKQIKSLRDSADA